MNRQMSLLSSSPIDIISLDKILIWDKQNLGFNSKDRKSQTADLNYNIHENHLGLGDMKMSILIQEI